jgi:hypothetical protein
LASKAAQQQVVDLDVGHKYLRLRVCPEHANC